MATRFNRTPEKTARAQRASSFLRMALLLALVAPILTDCGRHDDLFPRVANAWVDLCFKSDDTKAHVETIATTHSLVPFTTSELDDFKSQQLAESDAQSRLMASKSFHYAEYINELEAWWVDRGTETFLIFERTTYVTKSRSFNDSGNNHSCSLEGSADDIGRVGPLLAELRSDLESSSTKGAGAERIERPDHNGLIFLFPHNVPEFDNVSITVFMQDLTYFNRNRSYVRSNRSYPPQPGANGKMRPGLWSPAEYDHYFPGAIHFALSATRSD